MAKKRVTIRTLVALAGADISLAAGDEWEVDEDVAHARIALGLAEAIEPPAARRHVTRGGQAAETAAIEPDEKRGTSRDA
jgi:hypothetical protein